MRYDKPDKDRGEGNAFQISWLQSLRILVADDNKDLTLTLQLLLEEAGHVVRALDSGAGAVDAVGQFHPRVCIFDIDMPVTSGFAIGRVKSPAGMASRAGS